MAFTMSLVSKVSIPFRGFRCLQPTLGIFYDLPSFLFQSLSGVLDVCNRIPTSSSAFIIALFQSLSGVLDVCNCSLSS